MASIWTSFINGWRASARLWPIVLLVYLVDTVIAAAMAFPPYAALSSVFGHSVLSGELSGPISLDWLLELREGVDLSAFPWLLYLLAPLGSMLITTFIRGGILGNLAERRYAVNWAHFIRDCVRHFWKLLVLPAIVVPVFLAVALVSLLTLRIGLTPGSGGLDLGPAVIRAILLALLAFLLPTILDYGRVSLVLDPGRSVFRHLWRSIRFVVVRFPQVLLLGIALWASVALIAMLVPVLFGLSSDFSGFWTALLVQQASALLASWQRVAMLAAEMALFTQPSPARPSTSTETG